MSTNSWFTPTGSPPFINRVLQRSEFQEYIRGYNFGPIRPTKLVLHHTYRPRVSEWQGLKSMQAMQRYYKGLGWRAAPHIYVAPDGIWLATPMEDVGVHANACNGSVGEGWYSIGLEMVGDYDLVRPSGEVWKNALCVMDEFFQVRGLPIDSTTLLMHRQCNKTKSCPGNAVSYNWVVAELLAYRIGLEKPKLSAWVATKDTWIHQGPDASFPTVRPVTVGNEMLLADGTNSGWIHMAELGAFQDDEGFVRIGDLERIG